MDTKKASFLLIAIIILLFATTTFGAIPVDVNVSKEVVITLKKVSKRVSLADCTIADIKSICGYSSKGDYKCVRVMKEKCEVETCEKAKCEESRASKDIVSIKEIVLNGKKPGITSLIVWDVEGNKTFFDVIVTEQKREAIEKTYESTLEALRAEIKSIAPNDDINARFANDTIVLSGYAANQETIDKVVQIAQAYAIASSIATTTNYSAGLTTTTTSSTGKVLNHIEIKEASQVLLQVKVAQIDKDALKKLGISTLIKGTSAEGFVNLVGAPTSYTAGGGGVSGLAGIAGNAPGLGSYNPLDSFQIGVSYFPSGIGAVLQVLSSKNLAKVLAEPNLLVKSGQKGEFLAGSEIPIPVVETVGTTSQMTISYKPVGIKLNFAPEVTESGTIFLKIDPAEISNITGTMKVAGLESPMIDTRRVSTAVELKDGESLILAGLLSEEMIKSMQKIPILGDIPILGALFRSTSNELKHKELAFFITPKLVKPLPPGVKTELPGEKRPTPEEEQEMQWIPLPKKSDTGSKSK